MFSFKCINLLLYVFRNKFCLSKLVKKINLKIHTGIKWVVEKNTCKSQGLADERKELSVFGVNNRSRLVYLFKKYGYVSNAMVR